MNFVFHHVLCQMRAGDQFRVKLTAADQYGNFHTCGGAVKTVTVPGGGKRCGNQAHDVTCEIQDHCDGVYVISGRLFRAGNHKVVITDTCSKSTDLGTIHVSSGDPWGANCELVESNSYRAFVGAIHCVAVKLFDEYKNPAHIKDMSPVRRLAKATIGDQIALPYTGPDALLRGYVSTNFSTRFVVFVFVASQPARVAMLNVVINHTPLAACPIPFVIDEVRDELQTRLARLRKYLWSQHCVGYTPTLTVRRDMLLESAVQVLHGSLFSRILRIRFDDEPGIDMGGIVSEFFHLLSLEFVNANFALFQCLHGRYKPSSHSSTHEHHLYYFKFFGKILAKAICDGHRIPVRFVPCVYKYLLDEPCTLEDLMSEDPIVHRGLVEILSCRTDEEVELLAPNFTATTSHFGRVGTVELGEGGEERRVTLGNRGEYVQKLRDWLLTGCVIEQLKSLRAGFHSLIPQDKLTPFTHDELETILSGQSHIRVSFIEARAKYHDYTRSSPQVKWLWQVLRGVGQDKRSKFLMFCTGSGCLPIENWHMRVQKGRDDVTLLPTAATCFNSITLPQYKSKHQLKEKLLQAILYGSQGFLTE